MVSNWTVNRCVCSQLTFEEIKNIAKKEAITTISELMDKNICAATCKMCYPYVDKMLRTGKTEFVTGDYF